MQICIEDNEAVPFFRPCTQVSVLTCVLTHVYVYRHICAPMYACVHSLMHPEPQIWFKLPGCSSAAVLSRRV